MIGADLQLTLADLIEPEYEATATIQQRYEAWRDANQWVLPALADLLDDWSAHGGRKVGVKSAVEWLRWHHSRATQGSEWKFNNTFSSRLARDLIDRYPHLSEAIEVRKLRAA